MIYRIVLPREVASGNALAYRHWRKRMADRDAWIYLLRLRRQEVPVATMRRRVRLTAYRRRRVDEDNLSSGFKHGRDAMVRERLLIDDDRRGCEFIYNECRILSEIPPDLVEKYGRRPLTVLEIMDLPEPTAPAVANPTAKE